MLRRPGGQHHHREATARLAHVGDGLWVGTIPAPNRCESMELVLGGTAEAPKAEHIAAIQRVGDEAPSFVRLPALPGTSEVPQIADRNRRSAANGRLGR